MNLDAVLRDTLESTYVDDAYYARMRQDLVDYTAPGAPLHDDAAQALILHESWLLDQRAFEDWYQLYSRECVYWVPQARGVPDPVAWDPQTHVTIACDDRRRLGDRIVWLRTGVAYSQLPPSYTTHLSSGFVVVPGADPDELKVRSQFVVHEIRAGHQVQTMAGWAGHVLIREDGELKIARKLVALVDGDRDHHNLTFLL